MAFLFTDEDIRRIAETLGGEPQTTGDETSIWLTNPVSRQSLTVNLHNNVQLGKDRTGALVVAQTQHGYFELHDCSGFMVFEPDEVIFIGSEGDYISSIVVGGQCTCSMFVNIRREILSTDFTRLDPRVLMSAMQLSLTEDILP
jgi:hypothetical protein